MSRSRFILQQNALQARLFRSLHGRKIDARRFIKAFMNSSAAAGLDSVYDRMQWSGEEYVYQAVVEEAGLKPTKTRCRINPDVLFYAGWISRYWHYKTGESSKEIYRQCNEDRLLGAYGLHTEDNDLAIEDLKAANA